MTSPTPLLGLGLLLGLRHAMDPDHVVAVAAISARTRQPLAASWLGMVWGLGHTLTLFVAGGAIILLDVVVPPRVGLPVEFAVALALIAVGLLNLRGPNAPGPAAVGSSASPARLPALRAFVVGLVHGLAGSRWRGPGPGVRVATGVFSLVFGVWLVHQIGWRDGLFGALPRWTPH